MRTKPDRLFFGVPLTDAARRVVAASLPKSLPGKAVIPENWHFTVRFLGATDAERRDQLLGQLSAWYEAEKRSFTPHLTLARLDPPRPVTSLLSTVGPIRTEAIEGGPGVGHAALRGNCADLLIEMNSPEALGSLFHLTCAHFTQRRTVPRNRSRPSAVNTHGRFCQGGSCRTC